MKKNARALDEKIQRESYTRSNKTLFTPSLKDDWIVSKTTKETKALNCSLRNINANMVAHSWKLFDYSHMEILEFRRVDSKTSEERSAIPSREKNDSEGEIIQEG